tara:strand:+ start:169 stop:2667 length:2499 start_codon:yes stop_codon:yes gene_type:complete
MAERRSEKRITPDPVALNPIESNLEGIDPNIAQAVDAIDVALSEPDEANVEIQEDGSAIVGPELQAPINSAFTANLVDLIDVTELSQIFMDLYAAVERDKGSRKEWEQTYIDGLKYLGMQFDEERSQPFEGATGVIHPLLGEAVTQFQAQAYKELLPSGGPVKTQVVGDYTSQREEQAQRVKEFMNYQLLHVMQEYDPNLDQLLFYLPLSGSAFKKIYYNETMGRAMAQFIASENLVVPYETTDLLGCSRITHIIKMTRNEVLKLQATGFYADVQIDDGDTFNRSEVTEEIDRLQGVEPNEGDEEIVTIYEIHTNLDIAGFEDLNQEGKASGIKLPYIVTLDITSNEVLSIRRNWKEQDPLKNKIEYFVHYKFLPGLGFYGFGLTHMIGGLSKASTSILRQLIDAGTLSNLPAGFKTRGIRIRDEAEPIQPGEFRDVDAPGSSLRDSLMPLPFKEPSQTLLQLMGILVESGKRFASIADLNVGDGNQAAPVGTTVALLERGTKVMSAIHKRLHYAQNIEFKLLSELFKQYLPPVYPYATNNGAQEVKQTDFDDRIDILPVSNPDIFSTSQRIVMAQEMLKLVQSNPGIHGPEGTFEAYRRVYASLGVDNIDQLLQPPPDPTPRPVEACAENAALISGQPAQAFFQQNHDAHVAAHAQLLADGIAQTNMALQAMIQSHIFQHLQLKADKMAMEQMPPEIRQQYDQLSQQANQVPPSEASQLKQQAADMLAQFSAPICAQLVQEFMQKYKPQNDEDPLVTIRKQELALKGQDLAQRAQEFQSKEERQWAEMEKDIDIDEDRLNLQEKIALIRDETAQDRLDQAERFHEDDMRKQ